MFIIEDFKQYKLDAIPSLSDERDFKISRLIAGIQIFPEEFEIKYNGEVKNQNEFSSCVSHSLAYIKEIIEEKQSGKYKKFSVGFLYGNRDSDMYQGDGMYVREALKSLKNYGNVLFDEFSYNDTYDNCVALINKNKNYFLEKAYPFRISSYARLYTVEDIKTALINVGAVTVMYPVYQSFYDANYNNPYISIPKSNEHLYGYHELTVVGYTKDGYWKVLNSYGTGWCKGGYGYIPMGFPFIEAWSVSDSIIPYSTVMSLSIGSNELHVNNSIITMDVQPIFRDSRVFIPIRYIAESLGYTVNYLADTKEIQISDSTSCIKIKIGSVDVTTNVGYTSLVAAPFIENSRTFVPVRLAEALGATVTWNQDTQTVTISK